MSRHFSEHRADVRKTNREGLPAYAGFIASLRPKNAADWRSLWVTVLWILFGALCFSSVLYYKFVYQPERLAKLDSTTALIEDVRYTLDRGIDSPYGGNALYRMEILAKYNVAGTDQEKWITLQKGQRGLASAKFEAFQLKGKFCILRWPPGHPDRIMADVN